MGGYGSGYHRAKKTTVEACRVLDVVEFVRQGVVTRNVEGRGQWTWRNAATGEGTAWIEYEVKTTPPDAWVQLHYRVNGAAPLRYAVPLTTTPVAHRGTRWWFRCPAVGCGRRVRKLYLAPGGTYFACRHCYGLTYESTQTHNPHNALDALLASLGRP